MHVSTFCFHEFCHECLKNSASAFSAYDPYSAEKNNRLMSVECTNVLYGSITDAKKICHENYINKSTAFSELHINKIYT